MENLLILMFDLWLFTIYSIIGFIAFMTIQLISYRVFGFNLYKWFMYHAIDKQLKKEVER